MSTRFTIKRNSKGKYSIIDNEDIAYNLKSGTLHEEYNLSLRVDVERLCELLNEFDLILSELNREVDELDFDD